MWLEEEAVHVGQLHFVVVEEDEFPDAAAGEHLGSDAAHAPDAHNCHAEIQSFGLSIKSQPIYRIFHLVRY